MKIIKTALVAVFALACAAAAQANIVNFAGDTSAGPTFNRVVEQLTDLSAIGTDVAYDAYSFSVDTSGTYTFLTTAEFDSFTFLYQGGFDPNAPLSNALIGNDDLFGLTTSGLFGDLAAGTTYVFVVTGYANGNSGLFSSVIGGPGTITATPTASVPEAQTSALLALGLGALGLARRRRVRAS